MTPSETEAAAWWIEREKMRRNKRESHKYQFFRPQMSPVSLPRQTSPRHPGHFKLETFDRRRKSIRRKYALFSFFLVRRAYQSVEVFIENIFLVFVKGEEAKGETRVENVLRVLISFMLFKSINYDFFMVWIIITSPLGVRETGEKETNLLFAHFKRFHAFETRREEHSSIWLLIEEASFFLVEYLSGKLS